jgi:hypothetical protein
LIDFVKNPTSIYVSVPEMQVEEPLPLAIEPEKVIEETPPVAVAVAEPITQEELPQPVARPKPKINYFKEVSQVTTSVLMQEANGKKLIQSGLAKLIKALPQNNPETVEKLKGTLDGVLNFYAKVTGRDRKEQAITIANAVIATLMKADSGVEILQSFQDEIALKVQGNPASKELFIDQIAVFRSGISSFIENPKVLALDRSLVQLLPLLQITPTPPIPAPVRQNTVNAPKPKSKPKQSEAVTSFSKFAAMFKRKSSGAK